MMTVPVVFVVAGVALVVVAIIGGGLELKELKVPPIAPVWRVVSAGVGVVFIVLALVTSPPTPRSATDSQSPVSSASSAEPQGAIDAPLEGSTVERRIRVTGVIDPQRRADGFYWIVLQDEDGDIYPVRRISTDGQGRWEEPVAFGGAWSGKAATITIWHIRERQEPAVEDAVNSGKELTAPPPESTIVARRHVRVQ